MKTLPFPRRTEPVGLPLPTGTRDQQQPESKGCGSDTSVSSMTGSRAKKGRTGAAHAQYLKAVAMSSADLGAVIKEPTERITNHVGSAIAHEKSAKEERAAAQRAFDENIAFFYEVKKRLLNPGYRADVDGGKDRTPENNEKWFGAATWAAFNEKCRAYTLQHADRKLKAFAKAQGLLSDESISDIDERKGPEPRRTSALSAQKRYEHIATAAMEIASRNPGGDAERQILAAAEYVPAPLAPLRPDIYTEVLNFITEISKSTADIGLKAEAKRLRGKLLMHRPVREPSEVLADAEEEKRKRERRLAKVNGGPLGSAGYNPPAKTPEHVQKSGATGITEAGDDPALSERNGMPAGGQEPDDQFPINPAHIYNPMEEGS